MMTVCNTIDKRTSCKVYKNSGDPVERRDCQGLRLQTVKAGGVVDNTMIIDQHGRIFSNDRKMEFIACGYANH